LKKYNYKSVLIARKKRTNPEDFNHRPCFMSFFEENNPHLNTNGPKEVLEFDRKHKVIINGLDIHYLLPGNDIVINDLEELTVEENGEEVHVFGRQKRLI